MATFFATASLSITLWGQLLVDDFSYTVGTNITANGWTAHSSGGTNPIKVAASGLSYPGYASDGVGNAATFTTNGEDDNRVFASQTSGSVYVSFMINITSASTTGDYFFHFGPNPFVSSGFFAKVFVKQDGSNNLAFGIAKTLGTVAYTAFSYSLNTTYLITEKYSFNTGTTTDDQVNLWVNPALGGAESTPDVTQTDAGTDATGIGGVAIRQGASSYAPVGIIDGIRVATSWNGIPLPVELTTFTAFAVKNSVELAWNTATEVNNYGFEVERAIHSGLNGSMEWQKIGFVNGYGTSNAPHTYSFIDNVATFGAYSYRLKQIDRDGKFEYSKEVEATIAMAPNTIVLGQNYPNPFNPETSIEFAIPKAGYTTLKVYNTLGQEVATLVNGNVDAGIMNQVSFNGNTIASGLYFYTLRSGSFVETKKMLMVK